MKKYESLLEKAESIATRSLSAEVERPGYFGYTCIFAPEEIIHAAGFTPVRLFAAYDGEDYSEKYFHSRSCEFIRNLLQSFLTGKFDSVEGVVFSHCCDSLYATYETLNDLQFKVFSLNMPFIKKIEENEHFLDYLQNELKKFISLLQNKYGLSIEKSKIEKSISVYCKNSELLNKLSVYFQKGTIKASDFYTVYKAGMFIRKEKHNILLEEFLDFLSMQKPCEDIWSHANKILVSGFINGQLDWCRHLEKCGAQIVGDDLCDFSRRACDIYPPGNDPYVRVAANIIARSCPLKLGGDRYRELKQKCLETEAKGIIFFVYPFCDVQAIEHIFLKQKFAEDGIKTLLVEPSVNYKHNAQLETRIEAFLEILDEH